MARLVPRPQDGSIQRFLGGASYLYTRKDGRMQFLKVKGGKQDGNQWRFRLLNWYKWEQRCAKWLPTYSFFDIITVLQVPNYPTLILPECREHCAMHLGSATPWYLSIEDSVLSQIIFFSLLCAFVCVLLTSTCACADHEGWPTVHSCSKLHRRVKGCHQCAQLTLVKEKKKYVHTQRHKKIYLNATYNMPYYVFVYEFWTHSRCIDSEHRGTCLFSSQLHALRFFALSFGALLPLSLSLSWPHSV